MELLRKAFLLIVGAVAIAVEETTKSIEEANKVIEERRETLLHPKPPAILK